MSPKAWAKSLFQARPQSTVRTAAARPRLGVEPLEGRIVPAVMVTMLTGNAVVISADNPASAGGVDVSVSTAGRQTTVWENGLRRGDFTDAASVVFFGSPGNDSFKGGETGLPITAHGAAGNDFLRGGSGNDLLRGGSGDDILVGNQGDDRYEYVAGLQQGGDTLFTGAKNGAGLDTLDFFALTQPVAVDLGLPTSQQVNPLVNIRLAASSGSEAPQPLTVWGTGGADRITGNAAANRLYGNGGDDVLVGEYGDDILSGGMGNDTLDGGNGNDTYAFERGTFNPGHLGTDTVA